MVNGEYTKCASRGLDVLPLPEEWTLRNVRAFSSCAIFNVGGRHSSWLA